MSFFSRKTSSHSLSERKKRFLKSKNHTPYQLIVEDYKPIIEHYITKYSLENITVVINGETDSGRKKVAQNAQAIQNDIDVLENNEIAYAKIIEQYWVPPGSSIPSPFYLNNVDKKTQIFHLIIKNYMKRLKMNF